MNFLSKKTCETSQIAYSAVPVGATAGGLIIGCRDHGEGLDVHHQNPEQGKAAQDIERGDAFSAADGGNADAGGWIGRHDRVLLHPLIVLTPIPASGSATVMPMPAQPSKAAFGKGSQNCVKAC